MTSNPTGGLGDHLSAGEPVILDAEANRFALLCNGFDDLVARLDTTEDAIAGTLENLSNDIDDLKGQLAQLLKGEQERHIEPRRWVTRATRKDWDDLVDWVDQLNTDYSLLSDYAIPPCWPAHPGVVEELAGLWRSWTRSVITDQLGKSNGSNDLTAWHDRWLWPCLTRMKGGRYRTTNCRSKHQPENVNTPITDQAFLPLAVH
jgi:hypothetical protein